VTQRDHDSLEINLTRTRAMRMPLRQPGVRGSDPVSQPACILPVERSASPEVVKRVVAAGALEQLTDQRLDVFGHARCSA
jgi:hypothetical protein